jgi:hypothetical protein
MQDLSPAGINQRKKDSLLHLLFFDSSSPAADFLVPLILKNAKQQQIAASRQKPPLARTGSEMAESVGGPG